MAKERKIYFTVVAIVMFAAYVVFAAQPVPTETILTNNWVVSLENPEEQGAGGGLVPFRLGERFGYVSENGGMVLNREQEGVVSLSPWYWAEYPSMPERIPVNNPRTLEELVLDEPGGYPRFLDGRIFLVSKNQSSLAELDKNGTVLWTYDFEAPLTCIDAAGGYVLTGSLDGTIDLLDRAGKKVFPSFAPGVSRIPVILGCRLSSDGSKIALVCGVDKQRFVFLEWYSDRDYRITFHNFLEGEGFRREVFISFIDDDQKVAFEQEAGLGVFDVKERTLQLYPTPGRIEAFDADGGDGLFFYISGAGPGKKLLTALKLPGGELMRVPFESGTSFFFRREKSIVLGGGMVLASFNLNKR
ncbi:MAG: WD40 repeat domain-containing protein [Treponema sp.]|jgi:hypothetical protein|nr:WD40 repeat domain-containing protein [Treponema sp.]